MWSVRFPSSICQDIQMCNQASLVLTIKIHLWLKPSGSFSPSIPIRMPLNKPFLTNHFVLIGLLGIMCLGFKFPRALCCEISGRWLIFITVLWKNTICSCQMCIFLLTSRYTFVNDIPAKEVFIYFRTVFLLYVSQRGQNETFEIRNVYVCRHVDAWCLLHLTTSASHRVRQFAKN